MIMWEEAIGFYDQIFNDFWLQNRAEEPHDKYQNHSHLVEGENVEPGSFIAGGVEGDSHGILL